MFILFTTIISIVCLIITTINCLRTNYYLKKSEELYKKHMEVMCNVDKC